MRLEIDSATSQTQDAGGVSSAGAYGASSRAALADAANRDSAQVSGTSQILNNLATDRAARIQQLTLAVRNGTYNVPGALIAKSMISETAASAAYGSPIGG
jgi:anti-sigma28 factor (negative regulator of flagellin synthesis)